MMAFWNIISSICLGCVVILIVTVAYMRGKKDAGKEPEFPIGFVFLLLSLFIFLFYITVELWAKETDKCTFIVGPTIVDKPYMTLTDDELTCIEFYKRHLNNAKE